MYYTVSTFSWTLRWLYYSVLPVRVDLESSWNLTFNWHHVTFWSTSVYTIFWKIDAYDNTWLFTYPQIGSFDGSDPLHALSIKQILYRNKSTCSYFKYESQLLKQPLIRHENLSKYWRFQKEFSITFGWWLIGNFSYAKKKSTLSNNYF